LRRRCAAGKPRPDICHRLQRRVLNISQNARELIFAGTFTTGGLKTTVADGRLKILSEGKSSKFVEKVDQVTFSGRLAANNGQPVLYVTERCVFKLVSAGLELIEVAPGVDIELDILALMGFRPIIRSPKTMDASLFNEALMQLDDRLLNRPLSERLMFDEKRNTLFLGLDGYRVHKAADVEAIREGVFAIFARVGHRFSAIINYDSSNIAPDMADDWFRWRRTWSARVTTMSRAIRLAHSCASNLVML